MASQDRYGWYPTNQPIPTPTRWTIPERAPNALTEGGVLMSPNQGAVSLAYGNNSVPGGVLAPPGSYSQAAVRLAGSPKMGPVVGDMLPAASYGSDSGGSAVDPNAILGNANSLSSAYKNGSKLFDSITGGSAAGAGALLGTSGSAALGSAAPIAGDAALANLGGVTAGEMFGSSASAAAGAGAGSLGTSGGTSALTGSGAGASGGILAGSGLSTALPAAAVMFMAADALNSAGDKDSAQVTQWLLDMGTTRGLGARQGYVTLPDGRLIRADKKAEAAARAYYNGDPSYTDRLNEWLATAVTPKGG